MNWLDNLGAGTPKNKFYNVLAVVQEDQKRGLFFLSSPKWAPCLEAEFEAMT